MPPPGVSSTASSPPIASMNPRATASPSPTPSAARVVAEPLERLEHRVAVGRRDAGTVVDDPQLDPVARPRPPRPAPAGPAATRPARCRRCSRPPARAARIGVDPRQRLRDVDDDSHRADPRRLERPPTISSSPTSRCTSCTAPVCSRLMASRLLTSSLSRSTSSSIVSWNSCVASGVHATSAEQARHRRLDRRERRAQVVRHRGEQRGAQLVRLGEPGRGRDFGAEPPRSTATAPGRRTSSVPDGRRSVESPVVDHEQHARRADRHGERRRRRAARAPVRRRPPRRPVAVLRLAAAPRPRQPSNVASSCARAAAAGRRRQATRRRAGERRGLGSGRARRRQCAVPPR